MRFGVLGPVAVWTTGGEPVPVPGRKVRALLAVLLAHEGRPVPAARLIDALWGENLPGDPAGTLSGKVTQLRRALERAEPGGRRLVASPPPGYRLLIDADVVDAGRFRALTVRARETTDPRARAGLLSDALALWRGPAFADFADEPFGRTAAARLTEERLAAWEDYAEARLALGEHTGLVAELAQLLAAHPLRERLRAAHMRALYRSGRPGEALDSYRELRARLADALGLDPGPDLVALHRAVLARDPALAAPAPSPAVRPRTNLPAALSELIGRDAAVAAVRARLATGRLVTLTGPGGVGKTRLALETAGTMVDETGEFPDGVWLAELGGLEAGSAGRPEDVVMAALDIRDMTGAADRLVDALRARRLLLVLDNCEHVVEQAAELTGRLLRGCPGLRVLATSREPLGLPGEAVRAVPPLDVSGLAAEGADTGVAGLARSPAVRLFVARAAAAAPGFALTAGNAPAVAVLCRRLDGIPLALELAATRVRALGVEDLVARLDDRFRLLDAGRRDAPARQRTLTAMIDWSWDLLTEPERVVLRRLAVHADGCTLEAAEDVCAGPGAVDRADVAGLLARLVDRSVVTVAHGSGGPRYRLLESVAAYCGDRLAEAGETERVRDRHGRYYTELAVRAEDRLYGHDQRRWLWRLDTETANLRSALDHAVRLGDAERALRLTCALTWYWFLRGRLAEARRSLRAALSVEAQSVEAQSVEAQSVEAQSVEAQSAGERAAGERAHAALRARAEAWKAGIEVLLGEPVPAAARVCERVTEPVARARAEWFLAYAETDFGNVPAVDERLERALPLFRGAGDRWGTAAALSTRAKLGYLRADLGALERDGEESAALFRELGDRWGLLQATAWLGGLAEMVGDHVKATRLYREGLRMAEELGLWPEVSVGLASLGWIAVQQGDYPRARDLSGDALRLAAEQGFRVGETFAEMGVAFAARRQGDLDLAERHLGKLVRAAGPEEEDRAPPLYLPVVLTEFGLLTERRGDAAEARRLHLRALRTSRKLGSPRGVVMALEGLAGAVGLAGDHETSAWLLGAAAAARRAASIPLAPSEQAEIDRIATATRTALGETAFDAAHRDGRARTPDEVAARLDGWR
ncbi:BTAD domain-containing putative transcriptional regulator [Actinomadura sp. 3N407]|uniref:BTAD domain-containing putative transcriptional regulator n=1 Tax=Actinomadura sp. 3N407 TaxID=3457423 RepID=UPI003FCD5D05